MSYGKSYFKNKHMYIFIFIILLLILTYYINLQVNRINTLKEEITSLEKKHHLIFKKLTIAQNEAQTNSAYFKKVNSCLFISEINDMAQKTNLQILNFETEKNQEFAGKNQFTYNILLYGTIPNFIDCLTILEKKSYFLNIDKITIKNHKDSGENKFFLLELLV